MVETKILIDRKPLKYEGIFRLDELWQVIMRFFKERNFVMVELRNEEKNLPEGKDVFIELFPYRKMSDYLKKQFDLEFYMKRLKEREVEIDGRKQKFLYGEVEILFSMTMVSDWRIRFEGTGFYFLLRTLLDKFIRHDIITEAEDGAVKDLLDLHEEIKSYLNMTRFRMVEKGMEKARLREGL